MLLVVYVKVELAVLFYTYPIFGRCLAGLSEMDEAVRLLVKIERKRPVHSSIGESTEHFPNRRRLRACGKWGVNRAAPGRVVRRSSAFPTGWHAQASFRSSRIESCIMGIMNVDYRYGG